MKMGEIDWTLHGLDEAHFETVDELVPGWRDLTPAEFGDRMKQKAEEMGSESNRFQAILKALGGGENAR